jgi:hypothetical protein
MSEKMSLGLVQKRIGSHRSRSLRWPLRPEKNCTRRRNELIAKGAMNTGE